jgi:hypothetical protein
MQRHLKGGDPFILIRRYLSLFNRIPQIEILQQGTIDKKEIQQTTLRLNLLPKRPIE